MRKTNENETKQVKNCGNKNSKKSCGTKSGEKNTKNCK